jgi:exonuclease SbcD
VQFVLLPYPIAARYLKGEAAHFSSLDEKNQLLHQALLADLEHIKQQYVDPALPSVLAAHIHLRGSQVHSLYRISEREDVIFDPSDIPANWAYVALGHIHKPQALPGAPHVRYAGSIERLDFAERDDEKGAVLVEVGPGGRVGEPLVLPLDATPIYEVVVHDPEAEISSLAERYSDPTRAIVKYQLHYRPGEDNRDACVQEIEAVFPRWYNRLFVPEGSDLSTVAEVADSAKRDVPGTVLDFLKQRLTDHPDRNDLLALAQRYLAAQEMG